MAGFETKLLQIVLGYISQSPMYQSHFLLALSDINGDLAGQEHGQGRALWNWRLVEQGRLTALLDGLLRIPRRWTL